MSRSSQKAIPPILERYELKYHIPFDMIKPISDFILPYCSLDKYSEKEKDSFYQINNLYFDTPFFTFLKNRIERCENRFNIRIRSYGEKPKAPYFFEIKQKSGEIIKKSRFCYGSESIDHFFHAGSTENHGLKNSENKNIDFFKSLVISYNAEPKILTQYKRKAFISDMDDYARVTFDIGLKCMEENTFNVTPDNSRMVPYDAETIFEEGCNTILELKCYTSNVPFWMIDLIREFNLTRGSFSKYMNGILNVMKEYRFGFSNNDLFDI